ncbi:MAG: acyltransferase [Candidatus Acidiferrales bacterium]
MNPDASGSEAKSCYKGVYEFSSPSSPAISFPGVTAIEITRRIVVGARRPRLPGLTSLRFIAAFLVVLFHIQAMQIILGPNWFRALSSIGYVGVSFFFVLSGFILVYTYEGRKLKSRDFWRSRFARIYPAYAFSLLITAPWFFYAALKLNDPLFSWATAYPRSAYFLVVTLLQAWVPRGALLWNFVGWSLSVEAFFYLLFPLLLVGFGRRSRRELIWMVAACWLAGLALSSTYLWLRPDGIGPANAGMDSDFWLNALKFNPIAHLPEFFMGMLSGLLFLRSRQNDRLSLSLVVAGLAGCLLVVRCRAEIPYPMIHCALLAPAFAAIVCGFASRPRWGTLLENKFLVLFGDASYSPYLLHLIVIGIFFELSKSGFKNPTFLKMGAAVVVAVGISILAYRFIEVPARRLLSARPNPQPASLAAPALGLTGA